MVVTLFDLLRYAMSAPILFVISIDLLHSVLYSVSEMYFLS